MPRDLFPERVVEQIQRIGHPTQRGPQRRVADTHATAAHADEEQVQGNDDSGCGRECADRIVVVQELGGGPEDADASQNARDGDGREPRPGEARLPPQEEKSACGEERPIRIDRDQPQPRHRKEERRNQREYPAEQPVFDPAHLPEQHQRKDDRVELDLGDQRVIDAVDKRNAEKAGGQRGVGDQHARRIRRAGQHGEPDARERHAHPVRRHEPRDA